MSEDTQLSWIFLEKVAVRVRKVFGSREATDDEQT